MTSLVDAVLARRCENCQGRLHHANDCPRFDERNPGAFIMRWQTPAGRAEETEALRQNHGGWVQRPGYQGMRGGGT